MVAVVGWFGLNFCTVRVQGVTMGRWSLLGVRLPGQFLARKGVVDRDQFD